MGTAEQLVEVVPQIVRAAPFLGRLVGGLPILGPVVQYFHGEDHTADTSPQRVRPPPGKKVKQRTDDQKKEDRQRVLTLDDALSCVEDKCDSFNLVMALIKGAVGPEATVDIAPDGSTLYNTGTSGGDTLIDAIDACMRNHVLAQTTGRRSFFSSNRKKGTTPGAHGGARAGAGRPRRRVS